MALNLDDLLAPRIVKHCLPPMKDGHFRHAAREAMIQVELALKQKGKVEGIQFGIQLIKNLLRGGQGGILRVPLGDELQEKAEQFFTGVFSYYRNYAAHDGSKIDERMALRILIIASELLELIDAVELTLTDGGGVEALVRVGGFGSAERLSRLLHLLNGYHMVEETYDGLFEDLVYNDFGELELHAAMSLKLVKMHLGECENPRSLEGMVRETEFVVVEWFELSDLGREALEATEKTQ
jgi:hypothetical protein